MENQDPRLLAKKLESPTSLTEFAPLLTEAKPQTSSFSFRRFFWKSKDRPRKEEEPSTEEATPPTPSTPPPATPPAQPSPEPPNQDRDRSMATILRRISNLLDRSDNPDYNESDFKQYWMPDSNCRECYECGDKFTAFRRRHHCRICGQIFCSRCCNQGIPGKIMGYLGDLRACTYCCKVVLAYIRSLDSDLSSDVRALKESLQLKFGTSPPSISTPSSPFWSASIKRKSSMGFREEEIAKAKLDITTPSDLSLGEKKKLSQENLELSDLWMEVQGATLFRSCKYRQRWYDNAVAGCTLIDWMISTGHAPNRPTAIRLGQGLLDYKYLRCAVKVDQTFSDSPLPYRPTKELKSVLEDDQSSSTTLEASQDGHEPLWFKEIQMTSDTVSAEPQPEPMSRPTLEEPAAPPPSTEYSISGVTASEFLRDILYGTTSTSYITDSFHSKNWQSVDKLTDENGEKAAYEILEYAYTSLEHNLLRQLLDSEGLSTTWEDIILTLVHDATSLVHPEIHSENDDLDIRQYIKVKKIPGGTKADCEILKGVAWTKNVAHRKMRQDIPNPTILLLSTPIVYQRTENKLSSLEPIIMQEREYLKNIVLKIVMFKPDVLVVEKNVSRLAQDLLLKMGITLIYNVAQNVMERIARFTKAQLTTSIDAHLGQPIRGTCQHFHVQDFYLPNGKIKTLLIFDGCHTEQGCTILLRGGSLAELKRVKKIVQFLLYTAYNWRLEKSFLMDEYAMPPLGSEDMVADEFQSSSVTSREVVTNVVRPAELEISHSTSHLELVRDEAAKTIEKKYVEDFSDPLRSYLQMEEDLGAAAVTSPASSHSLLRVASMPLTSQFRKGLDGTILCCSPFITVALPYLETEPGKCCKLRPFFPEEIYWSRQFQKEAAVRKSLIMEESSENQEAPVLGYEECPPHPFVHKMLSEPLAKSTKIQCMLAEFRACGEKYRRVWHTVPNSNCDGSRHKALESTNYNDCPLDKYAGHLDVLSPYNHQKLSVLFCNHSYASNNAPNFCVDPRVVHMDFYGSNDITLGGFLERYCFNTFNKCHSCDAPMTEHIRKFVHDTGSIQIMLQKMEKPIAATLHGIFLWSWCTKCRQHTPISKMSRDAWTYSFAKYLELRFHGNQYLVRGQSCCHSLHQNYIQYFAHKNIVVTFSYTPIVLREVDLPPTIVTINETPVTIDEIVENIKCLSKKGYEVFNLIKEKLNSLQQDCADSQFDQMLNEMNECHQKETAIFRSLIEKIQLLVTSSAVERLHATAPVYPNVKEACETMWNICNDVVRVKMYIAEAVHNWNNKIEGFIAAKKKEEKPFKIGSQPSRVGLETEGSSQMPLSENSLRPSLMEVPEETNTSPISIGPLRSKSLQNLSETNVKEPLVRADSAPGSLWNPAKDPTWASPSAHFDEMKRYLPKKVETLLRHRRSISQIQERELTDSTCSSASSTYTPAPTLGLCSAAGLYPTDDIISSDTYVLLHHSKSNPPASTRHERSRSDGSETIMATMPSRIKDEEVQANKKPPTMKTLLSILLNSPAINPIPSPFPPTEHLLLPASDKIPIVVHDDDPGSLIAYVLTSKDYETQLQELNVAASVLKEGTSSSGSPLLKKRISKPGSLDAGSTTDIGATVAESNSPRSVGPSPECKQQHIEVQASDPTLRIYCKIYFAEHFRRLRALVLPQGEERFIRSLASCIPWAARGGKSGLKFRKTKDDRFVLKEMSKLEIQSFLEFGPHYLNYIYKACTQQMPTVLGKIMGVYRIGYKNSVNNTSHRADVLVMENLFYGRCISQKFDLKGSVRNRLVSPNTSRQDPGEIVLLDENLLKMSCDCPLYIRPHSKTVLTLAINNDARFLCEQSVMDYSLLVGVDDLNKELVVGIIDYIRTFTWDKKLEMVVKSSGILGGHGKLPTVVSPEIYQARFCEAMDKYFLYVPDRWFTLGKDLAH